MSSRLYYLMSLLPALPALGNPPPITTEELFRIIREERSEPARTLAEAFNFAALLMEAAENRLLGYPGADTLGAYSIEPEAPPILVELFLLDPQEIGEDLWFTELWREYFGFLETIGQSIGSSLLVRWTHWESALREQLMQVRRQAIGTFAGSETAKDTAATWDHSALIAEWRKTSDPMVGERLLDEARIGFIETESAHYSFGIDELVAYFLKLSLLLRHAGLNREAGIKILEEVTAL